MSESAEQTHICCFDVPIHTKYKWIKDDWVLRLKKNLKMTQNGFFKKLTLDDCHAQLTTFI